MKKILCFFILLFGALYVNAQPPSAGYYLNGIDDYIQLDDTDNINTSVINNRTIEGWFKVVNGSARQVVYEEGAQVRSLLVYVENNYIHIGVYNKADYTPRWEGSYFREPINNDQWYHFALILENVTTPQNNPISATDNTGFKWYLDGVNMGEQAGFRVGSHPGDINVGRSDGSGPGLFFADGPWFPVGLSEYCFNSNSSSNNNYYFNGYVWGLRIWNDVRTQQEIVDNQPLIITTLGVDDLVAFLDGDSVGYLDDDDNEEEDSGGGGVDPNRVWSSTAADGNWNNASNWVGGLIPDPGLLETVIIPTSTNYPILGTHIILGDLTLDSGTSIDLQTGATLDVSYGLDNNGAITVEEQGSLLYRKNIDLTGTGNYIVKRNTPNYSNPYFYSFWSSPIVSSDANLSTLFPYSDDVYYCWDTTLDPSNWGNAGTQMVPGVGYAVRSTAAGSNLVTFDGAINNGEIVVPIANTEYADTGELGFNLIGNPYPCAIQWENFVALNRDEVEETMYYWKQVTAPYGPNLASEYIDYNNTGSNPIGMADGEIGTGQAFFVKAKAGTGGSVTFANTDKIVGNNDQFFRTSNTMTYPGRVSFKLENETLYATQLIGFLDRATTNYDDGYDGYFINYGAPIEFYSLLGDSKLSIQGYESLQGQNVTLPIGFRVDVAGVYTLSLDANYIDSAYEIELEDTETGIISNLKYDSYTFEANDSVTNDSRFLLHFRIEPVLNVDDEIIDNQTTIHYEEGVLSIWSPNSTNWNTVEVFSMDGRLLQSTEFSPEIPVESYASGVYILRLKGDNGSYLTKKWIK